MSRQISLFKEDSLFDFPSTRYQGSKNKLREWIWENIKDLEFETALDLFGGTGSVSYLFKKMGKKVVYNDLLKSNYTIGLALIENDTKTLTQEEIGSLIARHSGMIIEEVAELAVSETKKTGSFTLPGIGKLVLVKRKARMGRNPATGATIKIPAKTVVKMRVAKAAKESIVPGRK